MLLPRNRPPGGMWARLAAQLPPAHQQRIASADVDDFPAALDLVAAGAGLLPAPSLLVESIRRHDVRFVPLDAGDLRITYGLAWRADGASAEVMALVSVVQESLRTR